MLPRIKLEWHPHDRHAEFKIREGHGSLFPADFKVSSWITTKGEIKDLITYLEAELKTWDSYNEKT